MPHSRSSSARRRIGFIEPTGPTGLGPALATDYDLDALDPGVVDRAAADPESLSGALPADDGRRTLVVTVARGAGGGAGDVDWTAEVHVPLARYFTAVRGLVPALVAHPEGGDVVVVLPSTALFADASRCAESVLGRSLLGLFEGLRAELLNTAVRVEIVIADPGDTDADIARRVGIALEGRALYALPASVTTARVDDVFDPWLDELARTPADLALPPLGPMGEVYRRELPEPGVPAVVAVARATVPAPPPDDDWPAVAVPGKTAIVTGGASGIGLGIAEALLERGLNVVIADVRDDHLATAGARLESYRERVLLLRLDVTDAPGWRVGADTIIERFGAIDLLFLNAGIGVLGTILDSSPADWQWLMGVNLDGVTNGIDVILPLIREHRAGGHIVATSSAGGLMVAEDGGIYSAGKFGVVALMECLADELRSEHIGVTTLCPAGVNTNIHDHEDMRPEVFRESGLRGSRSDVARQQAMAREMLAKGADPRAVGERIVEAIARRAPVLFTDGGIAPIIALRRDALRAAATRG